MFRHWLLTGGGGCADVFAGISADIFIDGGGNGLTATKEKEIEGRLGENVGNEQEKGDADKEKKRADKGLAASQTAGRLARRGAHIDVIGRIERGKENDRQDRADDICPDPQKALEDKGDADAERGSHEEGTAAEKSEQYFHNNQGCKRERMP